MVAGLLVTVVTDAAAGLRALALRIARWRVPVWCYLVAIAPLGAGLFGLGARMLAGSGFPSAMALAALPGLPALGWLGMSALVLLINGYGEEVGWCGVAWPKLRRHHSLAQAALLLAAPWALWHLPTFWLDTGLRVFNSLRSAGLAAGSVLLGWLYDHGRRILLLVAVFHANLNLASDTEATAGLPAAVTTAAVMAAAVAIMRHDVRREDTAGTHGRPVAPRS